MSSYKTNEQVEALRKILSDATRTIRVQVANGVKEVLQGAAGGTISKAKRVEVSKSIKQTADVIRNAAVLIDSLHELATSKVVISMELLTIVNDVEQLVSACTDLNSLAAVDDNTVRDIIVQLDKSSETLEKSEEVLDLLDSIAQVEVGIRNTGLDVGDFVRLAGVTASAKLRDDSLVKPSDLRGPLPVPAEGDVQIDYSSMEHRKLDQEVNDKIEARLSDSKS